MSGHLIQSPNGAGLLVVSISGPAGCWQSSLGSTMRDLLQRAGWVVMLRDAADITEAEWHEQLEVAVPAAARAAHPLAVISIGSLG